MPVPQMSYYVGYRIERLLYSAVCICRFAEDYRIALQKSYAWMNQVPPDVTDAQGFFVRPRRRQRQSIRVKTEVLTLSFWSLNPAVVRG